MAKNRTMHNYQKKFTKFLRSCNKALAEDPLWKGRFYVIQQSARIYHFPDNSGGIMTIFIRCWDRQTNYYHDYRLDYAPWLSNHSWNMLEYINDFIVEKCGVWRKGERPTRENTIDYRAIPIKAADLESIKRKPWNFYYYAN